MLAVLRRRAIYVGCREQVCFTSPRGARKPPGCGNDATVVHMSLIASRDLRNHTADVLRRVAAGDRVTITVNGAAVAELGPVSIARRPTISKADLITLLHRHQADAGMREDLADLTAGTTADLDPLQ
ncbi:MAG: type II toxin-antitoxin system Phd/YefM family antitoxin [Jatrophihabitans sp.]